MFKRKKINSEEFEQCFKKYIEVLKRVEELEIKQESTLTMIKQLRGKLNAKIFKESPTEKDKYGDNFDFIRNGNKFTAEGFEKFGV